MSDFTDDFWCPYHDDECAGWCESHRRRYDPEGECPTCRREAREKAANQAQLRAFFKKYGAVESPFAWGHE